MRIAITGSIACGKSTVLQLLKARGFPVVDADEISRSLTAPEGEALPDIRDAFGDGIFDGETLNRQALASLVFSDPSAKHTLESILHPAIRKKIIAFLDQQPDSVPAFAEVPLLYESGMECDYDAVWVVSAPEEVRIERLLKRDGLSREEALKRIHAQMPLAEKERRADAVIHTDGPLYEIEQQLDNLLSEALPNVNSSGPHTLKDPSIQNGNREPHASGSMKAKRRSSLTLWLSSLPVWMRVLIAAAASSLILTIAVLLIRDYTARQEIRRQKELEAAERASHPLYYEDLILRDAKENQLDPALVSAVILCESSFHPDAVSRLGARGLMQIMEETAEWIAHRLGEDGQTYSYDLLFDPETSIRYGTWYLGYLSRRFDADPKKIICAYHAGQGNVDNWLHNRQYSADGISLDVIPKMDTLQYYNRVSDAIRVYKQYYFPDSHISGGPSSESSPAGA